MARHSLTWRLTLSFTVVMAILLVTSGAAVYLGVRFSLDRELRRDLTRQADELHRLVRDGDVARRGDVALHDRADSYAQVLDATTGEPLGATPPLRGRRFLTDAQVALARRGEHAFDRGSITDLDRHALRIVTRAARQGATAVVEVVAVRRDTRDEALRELLGQLAIAGFATLCLTALVGYRLTRAALIPVDHLRAQASELYDSGTGDRLLIPATGDELARLAETLNAMLSRVDAAIERERAFSASAGHELRTPLTLLKTQIDLALRRPRTKEELTTALREAGGDVDRLAQIVEGLLAIAQGERRPALANVPLGPIVRRLATRWQPSIDPDRTLTVSVDEDTVAMGNASLVESALENLLVNAIRHGRGNVDVTVTPLGDTVEIHVTDEGDGFPPEFRRHAFERFARAPNTSADGAGLGLAIVAAAMASQDGRASVSNRPQGGADAWLELARAATDPEPQSVLP